jgi:hypothetical protein
VREENEKACGYCGLKHGPKYATEQI